MERTRVFDCQPDIWTEVPIAGATLLQVREPKAVRLHFADSITAPAVDTDAYIVTQDYDPKLFPVTGSDFSSTPATLFVMPDEDETVKVVVAYP
jgi:hypothetical protein